MREKQLGILKSLNVMLPSVAKLSSLPKELEALCLGGYTKPHPDTSLTDTLETSIRLYTLWVGSSQFNLSEYL